MKFEKDIKDETQLWMSIMVLFNNFIVCAVCLFICQMCSKYLNLRIPLKLPLMVIMMVVAVGVQMAIENPSSYLKNEFAYLKYLRANISLCTYVPLLILRACFTVEAKLFLKLLPQMFLISATSLLCGILQGLVLKVMKRMAMSTLDCMLYGMILCTTQPHSIVNLFKNMQTHRHFHYVLEGESILTIAGSIVIFDVLFGIKSGEIASVGFCVVVIVRLVLGGFIVGSLAGITLTVILKNFDMTPLTSTTFIGMMMIVTHGFSVYINVSGIVANCIMGVLLLIDKRKFFKDSSLVPTFFSTIFNITDVIFCTTCLVVIIFAMQRPRGSIIFLFLFNYVSVMICRFITLTLLYPVLRKAGFSLNLSSIAILSWSSVSSCVALIILNVLQNNAVYSEFSCLMMPYVFFNMFCSFVINDTCISILIKYIHANTVSAMKITAMTDVLKHLENEKNKFIGIMKSNRMLGDVNWPIVREMTTIVHPYKLAMSIRRLDEKQQDLTNIICPICVKPIPFVPTKRNLAAVRTEQIKSFWKQMKIILVRQYEFGMVSEECAQLLVKVFEDHIESTQNEKDLFSTKLIVMFKENKCIILFKKFHKKFLDSKREQIRMPRKPWRRACYKIVMSKSFIIFIYIIIVLVACTLIYDSVDVVVYTADMICAVFFNVVVVIYLTEFWLTIFAYSWIRIFHDGFKTYFSSVWHFIDFIAMLGAISDVVYFYYFIIYRSMEEYQKELNFLRFHRLIRLLRTFSWLLPKLFMSFDSIQEVRLSFAYEVAQAYNDCVCEMSIILDSVLPDSPEREYFREYIEEKKIVLFQLMTELETRRPWIPATIKTKQIICSTRYAMLEALNYLRSSGFVDDIEHVKLSESIRNKEKILKSMKKIKAATQDEVFNNVAWMTRDLKISHYLYSRALIKTYKADYILCRPGDHLDGLIIIISGFLKVDYTPTDRIQRKIFKYGCLPVVDYLDSVPFDRPFTLFISVGNTIGSLNFLTGRPANCTITALIETKTFFLQDRLVREAIKRHQNTFTGLQANIWKTTLINLAKWILTTSRQNDSFVGRSLWIKLEHACVPDLSSYKAIIFEEHLEDVLLLEGVGEDFHSRHKYVAPCYIPRNVNKLVFIKNRYVRDVKIMLIPHMSTEIYDIVDAGEGVAKTIPWTESLALMKAGRRGFAALSGLSSIENIFSL